MFYRYEKMMRDWGQFNWRDAYTLTKDVLANGVTFDIKFRGTDGHKNL